MSLLKRESLLSLSFFIALKMTELNVPIERSKCHNSISQTIVFTGLKMS